MVFLVIQTLSECDVFVPRAGRHHRQDLEFQEIVAPYT